MRQLTLGVLLVGGGFLAGLAFQPGLPGQVAHALVGNPAPLACSTQTASQTSGAATVVPPEHVHELLPAGTATPGAGVPATPGAGVPGGSASGESHGHGGPGPGDPSCGLAQ